MGVVAIAGSFNLREIVEAQRDVWFIIPQFLGFLIFVVAGVAVTSVTHLTNLKQNKNWPKVTMSNMAV